MIYIYMYIIYKYMICVFLNGFQGTNRRIAIFWLGQNFDGKFESPKLEGDFHSTPICHDRNIPSG